MWYTIKQDKIKEHFDNKTGSQQYQHLVKGLYKGVNPYDGFNESKYPYDLYGWISATSHVLTDIIKEAEPEFVIEVGTWLGMSALKMAATMCDMGINNPCILCIDTWLGSAEHWNHENNELDYRSLRIKHGHPSIYFQFLTNIKTVGAHNIILPFQQVSVVAALVLKRLGIQSDAIYLDASHHYIDVITDIASYWDVLKPGGIMFGDDFGGKSWPGVTRAVLSFREQNNDKIESFEQRDQFWIMRKKSDIGDIGE